MRSTKTSRLSLVAAAALAACQNGESAAPVAAAPTRVGPEERVQPVDPHLGFQPAADGFRAAADTHTAVVRDGVLEVIPLHWDGQQIIEGAPVSFTTASVQRGEGALAAGAPAVHLAADGALELARGAVTEILQNSEYGVEQSWRFAAPPAGGDDLTVAVSVAGHQTVATSATGLHFMTPGRLGFRYSHATWVDAAGRTWSIPATWDGQNVVLRVPGEVLDSSAYPAVLDPTIGAQVGMDAVVSGYTGGQAQQPAIARADSNYLVVWSDDRNGGARESEIYAARLRADNTLIDRRGIQIAASVLKEHEPAVTWTGTAWLVAWTEVAAAGTAVGAATVSATGTVTPLGVVSIGGNASDPALASAGGGGALLVYQSAGDLRGTTFDGAAFGPSFAITDSADLDANPTIARAGGTDYLVAWQRGPRLEEDIYGRLVSGGAVNGASFAISVDAGSQTRAAAAFDGTDYVVVWRSVADIWGSRVSTAGAVLDSTGPVGGVALSATPTVQTDPAVICATDSCLLAWADRRDTSDPDHPTFDLYGQRLGFDLAPLGGEFAINDRLRNQYQPALAPKGTGFMATWADQRTSVTAVFSARVGADGSVADPDGVLVSEGRYNSQNRPSYAIGATTQLAVWSDSRSFGDDIMARRFDASGSKLDDGALVVSDAQWDQTGPSVVFDGSQYVVAWGDARNPTGDVYAARFAEDGTLRDPAGIPVSTADLAQGGVDLAAGGGATLAAWQDRRDRANGYDIMAAVIAPDGSLAVADIPVCVMAGEQTGPSVAWDPAGSVFVVAWSDRRTGDIADIYAARVQIDGSVLDPCGVAVTTGANDQVMPDVAASAGQLLIVWEDYRDDLTGDIYGARIDTAGELNVLDAAGVPIATGASAQTSPTAVGVSGGRWGIAWVDNLNQTVSGTDLYGHTMAADGTLDASYLISGDLDWESGPVFQTGVNSGDRAYLMYERDRPDLGLIRVRRRAIRY